MTLLCDDTYLALFPITEGNSSSLEARRPRAALMSDGREAAARRRLGARSSPVYVPGKAANCETCAACKQQYQENPSMPPPSLCRKACKKCPDVVVLGAESTLSVEVDGITATEYLRDNSVGGSGPRRALQGSTQGAGITVKQYATTVFEGTLWGKGFTHVSCV